MEETEWQWEEAGDEKNKQGRKNKKRVMGEKGKKAGTEEEKGKRRKAEEEQRMMRRR